MKYMNFITRGIQSLKERKGKSLIILSIMLTVCFVILASFSIQSATEVASDIARQKLGAEVTITPDMEKLMSNSSIEGGFRPTQEPTPIEYLDELSSSQYVVDHYIKSTTTANINDLTPVGSTDEELSTRSNGDITLNGVNDLEMDSKVYSGTIELLEGRELTEDDLNQNVVLIEETLALQNELNLGDKFTLSTVSGEVETEVEIVGIFKDTGEIDQSAFKFTSMLPYNTMYAPYTVANSLKGDDFVNAVDSITFLLDDPINVQTFIEEASTSNIDFNTFKLDAGDTAYEAMMGPIENVASFSKTTLIMVTIFGGVILSLIVMLSIKDRVHEIGILMSLGEKKVKIVGQLLCEITLVLVVALGISGLFGNTISSAVGDTLIQNEIQAQAEESSQMQGFGGSRGGKSFMNTSVDLNDIDPIEDLDIKVSGSDFAKMSGCALLVSIIATIIPSSFVMRLNPKNILSRHS